MRIDPPVVQQSSEKIERRNKKRKKSAKVNTKRLTKKITKLVNAPRSLKNWKQN